MCFFNKTNATITDSKFYNNSSPDTISFCYDCTLQISKTIFLDNSVENSRSIFWGNGLRVLCNSSIFSSNVETAIELVDKSEITLKDSRLHNNYSPTGSAALSLVNCTFKAHSH